MNQYSWHTSKQKDPAVGTSATQLSHFQQTLLNSTATHFINLIAKEILKPKEKKLLNSKMRSIYGRKWPKMKKLLKNMTVVRLKDFNDIKDRRFLEFPITHSAIVELAPGEI